MLRPSASACRGQSPLLLTEPEKQRAQA